MTIFTKIKTGQFVNIPPSKRWLIPHILQRILLMSVDTRRESGVTRDGRRNKYEGPHQGRRESLRRVLRTGVFVIDSHTGTAVFQRYA